MNFLEALQAFHNGSSIKRPEWVHWLKKGNPIPENLLVDTGDMAFFYSTEISWKDIFADDWMKKE